jgi:glycerate 2-kinase
MQLRVLVAPDKFKGTLTASQAAEAIAVGWQRVRPGDHLDRLPITDGGDGFGEVMRSLFQAQRRCVRTVDAAGRPLESGWWWHAPQKTAILESAQTIGLASLPPGQFHPFDLDTYGLGAVIMDAHKTGARRCLMGIGGSATNEAGFGLLRALGWSFLDTRGAAIESWPRLDTLETVRPPRRRRWFNEFLVAVDVQNPLLGRHGASRIYGPQKGLQPVDFPLVDRCFRRLTRAAKRLGLPAGPKTPGAGAAGGLGYALRSFLGGQLKPGFELFAEHAQLSKALDSVDLVITAEGAIDASSLMGKGVGELARLCRARGIPCLGLAGSSPWAHGHAPEPFTELLRIVPECASLEASRRRAAYWLAVLAGKAAQNWANNLASTSVLTKYHRRKKR